MKRIQKGMWMSDIGVAQIHDMKNWRDGKYSDIQESDTFW